MKPFRNNQIYISEKCDFYAHILCKAKFYKAKPQDQDSFGMMTKDQLCDAELIDKWEKEFPALVLAYEENCKIRQQNKKAYEQNEKEILDAICPVPGGKLKPAAVVQQNQFG